MTVHGCRGPRRTPAYLSWVGMKQRRLNPRHKFFPFYGGRGIGICERWMEFPNFIADTGPRPRGKTLDRKDVDGDYSPENCRWATIRQQNKNRRTNRIERQSQ